MYRLQIELLKNNYKTETQHVRQIYKMSIGFSKILKSKSQK